MIMVRMSKNGVGLVSVIVLIVGIGVIVAVASPIAIMMIQEARLRATLHEMESLKEAIALYHPGEVRGFGFIGDVGRFPLSLVELVTNIYGLPSWSVTTGIGWRGPYIGRGFAEAPDAYRQDGWGNFYDYFPATGVIRSRGSDGAPDGTGYAADFSTSALTHLRVGTIRGQIRDILGKPLPDVVVSVKEPVGGIPTWGTPVMTNAEGFYSLSNVIVGRRRLRATLTSGGVTSTHFFYSEVTPHIEARADFRIARDVTIPRVPTALTATPTVFGGIGLEWLPPTGTPDLAGFNIYRFRQESFPLPIPTLIPWSRIATLGLVHFFYDNTVSPHYIYHYIVRAFDRAGNESDNSASVSASTANGTDNVRNVNRAARLTTDSVTIGMRNFSGTGITVTQVMVSWTGTPPDDYINIWTRIPTSADWVLRSDVEATSGEVVELDPPFTLTAYGTTNSEGIFRVGFNATAPTIITVVLNPGAGAPAESTIITTMW